MHLWTEYEGNTLAGYTLGRLSRSEGRSAFFQTVAQEQPALLRLTESHFDEGELIGRWKQAAAVAHSNLQAIRDAGETTFDNVALAYCLLEPTDATLSDVLRERVLTPEEASDVAEAVARALAALHAAGLVHEHVDATNVFAQGEVVKLRSDCVRACAGDFEADTAEAREALRARDVHDLGLLLRRCLCPQWEESSAMQLPRPFDRVVRRALNGTVSAEGIVAEFEALRPAPLVVPTVVKTSVAPVAAAGTVSAEVEAARAAVRAVGERDASEAKAARPFDPSRMVAAVAAHSPQSVSAALADGSPMRASEVRPRATALVDAEDRTRAVPEVRLHRVRDRSRYQTGVRSVGVGVLEGLRPVLTAVRGRGAWVAGGVAAAVLGVVVWSTTGGARDAAAGSEAKSAVHAVAPMAPADAGRVSAPAVVTREAAGSAGSRGGRGDWHVIAYTFNHEQQAVAKVERLRQRFEAMEPQVFSPSGRAPYFVALGGASDAGSALQLRNRARRAGLPRDTFARNF